MNAEQRKEHSKKYREENPDKVKAAHKKWRYKNPNYEREWREKNKEYIAKQKKEYRLAHAEQTRHNFLMWHYGIGLEEYNLMLQKQNGLCAICKSNKNWQKNLFVDHDHKSGKVRGLLCGHCNSGIGYFKDNPKLLNEAVEYITQNYK